MDSPSIRAQRVIKRGVDVASYGRYGAGSATFHGEASPIPPGTPGPGW